jgi:hypothetical protein
MWTLFKREFEDVWFYLIAAILLVGGSIAWAELMLAAHPASPSEQSINGVLLGFTYGYLLLCILLLGVGANRMVFDRANGISVFYTGHLITRGRVFIVRLLLGALFVVLFYVPLVCWFLWRFLRWLYVSPENSLNGQQVGMMLFLFLFLLTCYNLGLRMGLYNKRIIYTLGTACLGVILLSFVVLKGFGYEAVIILLVLNVSLIYSAWRNYAAAAL